MRAQVYKCDVMMKNDKLVRKGFSVDKEIWERINEAGKTMVLPGVDPPNYNTILKALVEFWMNNHPSLKKKKQAQDEE